MKHQWRADPLVWGHGPEVFEMFLEPTCPFSAKAFGKLDQLFAQAGEDRVTDQDPTSVATLAFVLGHYRAMHFGCLNSEDGKNVAKVVMSAVATHREEFEFDHHCGGPNLNATPNDIITRLRVSARCVRPSRLLN